MIALDEKLNKLPPERRKRVQERAQALRVEEGLRYLAPSFQRTPESRFEQTDRDSERDSGSSLE